MKKKTILLLVILGGAATASAIWFATRKKKQPVSFVTAKAQYGYISKSVTATGNIQPVDTVSVGSQVSGMVQNIYADFNSEVTQGQLLAKIDPSVIMAQVEVSKANLANVRSNLQLQQSNYSRQSQLYNLGAISKADYQIALNQYNMARAAVANAQAQLRVIEQTLSYTNIYSPVTGVVLNRNVSAGQTIASSFNSPTLFVIAKDLTKMQANAAVDEADIGRVRAGQRVTFTVDAFPDDVFEGVVRQILLHASVTAGVVTYATLINVDNGNLKLKPGMTASISIYVEEDSNALLIPSKALTFKPDSVLLKQYMLIKAEKNNRSSGRSNKEGNTPRQKDSATVTNNDNETRTRSFVWIQSGDTLTEKRIITGLNDDSFVKVLQGLSPGELVITGMATNDGKVTTEKAARSPFMPQTQRRSGGGGTRPN